MAIHNEISAGAFLAVRQLAGEDRGEFLLGHSGARQNPAPLHIGRSRDDDDPVYIAVATGLEQQWNVEHGQRCFLLARCGEELLLLSLHQRMDDLLEPGEITGMGSEMTGKLLTVDAAVCDDAGEGLRYGRHGGTA